MSRDSLNDLNARLLAFARERDWEQFHSPKNLSMALAGEAGELLEHFQWRSFEESEAHCRNEDARQEIADEMADIAIYLTEMADNLGIDLLAAMASKLDKNAAKYPVEKARGSHKKYSDLE